MTERKKKSAAIILTVTSLILIPAVVQAVTYGRTVLQKILAGEGKGELNLETFEEGSKELEALPKSRDGQTFAKDSAPKPSNKGTLKAIGDPWICTSDGGGRLVECVHYVGHAILACLDKKGVLSHFNFIYANHEKSDNIDEIYRYYPATGQWRYVDLPGDGYTQVPACDEALPGGVKSAGPSNAWLERFNKTELTFIHMAGAISAGPRRAVVVDFVRHPATYTTPLPFDDAQEMAGAQYLGVMLLATRLRADRYLGPRKDFGNNGRLRDYQRDMTLTEEAVATEILSYAFTAALKGL